MVHNTIILIGWSLLYATMVHAHPHVWIYAKTTFLIHNKTVTGIIVEWEFDDFYGNTLIADFDKNRNYRFEAKEIKALKRKAFQKTAHQNYFTFVKINGKLMRRLVPTEFHASIDYGKVNYRFALHFPKPVNPRHSRVTVTYYESSYYIDVTGDKVSEKSDGSLVCTSDIVEDSSVTIYYNSINPLMATLRCRT